MCHGGSVSSVHWSITLVLVLLLPIMCNAVQYMHYIVCTQEMQYAVHENAYQFFFILQHENLISPFRLIAYSSFLSRLAFSY